MKYALQIGLLAAMLFSVSAGLSIWLNRSPTDTAHTQTGEEKAAKKATGKEAERPEKDPAEPKTPPRPEPTPGAGSDAAAAAAVRDREARLEKRAAQIDLILRDLQAAREAHDALLRQVTAELKQAAGRVNEVEAKAADLEKKKVDLDAAEKKNLERMAGLYDAMAPETAGPILKQMADSGRMDTAVKVLALMKERQAARVLEALGDTMLAAQLLDRMRGLKATTGLGAAPAGGGTPPPAPPRTPGP